MDKIAVVVPAAGQGRRMGSRISKQYLLLGGKPVLVHTLEALEANSLVAEIVVVARREEIDFCQREIIGRFGLTKVKAVVEGGKERQDSVFAGLQQITNSYRWVAVHDGVRPLLTSEVMNRVFAGVQSFPAVAAAVPLRDTVKLASADGWVEKTLPREGIWAIQTPQAFERELLLKAHQRAKEEGFYATDDAALVERLGVKVRLVMGSSENLKVTTPEDLVVAEAILARRVALARQEDRQELALTPENWPQEGSVKVDDKKPMRVGIGYDVHRFVAGRRLILGGVEIPSELGLEGHSDADVLLHAVMDALLGALALGDIGQHFPNTDWRYKDVSSLVLLREVGKLIFAQGYRVGNLDCTVIAESPKLAPFAAAMREVMARELHCGVESVSIKATTNEGLGFVGRKEGIAAMAVAMLLLGEA